MQATQTKAQWLSEIELAGASPATIRNYARSVQEALRIISTSLAIELEELSLEAIDRDAVIAAVTTYRNRPDGRSAAAVSRAAASVSVFYGGLHAFLAWCVKTERLAQNPASSVRAPKIPQRIPKALPVASCEALLAAAGTTRWPERDRLAVLLGLTMGLRLAEMAGIRLEDAVPHLERATHLRVIGKGNKQRVVPVPEVVRDALASYLPTRAALLARSGGRASCLFISQRVTRGSQDGTVAGLGQVFDRLVRAAGLKAVGVRAHVARHSFATHVLAGDSDIMTVKELLGHSSVATTQIYLKVDPARLTAAVEGSALTRLQPGPA